MRRARALAGVLGDVGPADVHRVRAAVGEPSIVTDRLIAATDAGGPPPGGGPVCLLAGSIYAPGELARSLGEDPSSPVHRLLARAWERDGSGMANLLRGDFTLLVWDERTQTGLLARDQLGTGSVFFREAGRRLAFATEEVELLRLLPARPSPDDRGVVHWLAPAASRPGISLHEGVRRLEPGGCLELTGRSWRPLRYWAPRPVPGGPGTRAEAAEAVEAALRRAVSRRLDHGGGTGVLMSGGLDSGGVAALARGLQPGGVTAFSEVFPEHPSVDESAWIDRLGRDLALPVTRMEAGAQGVVAEIATTVQRWAVPPVSFNFWNRPLYEAAREAGVSVLLTGDGGDELFAAPRTAVADRLRAGRPLAAIRLARALPLSIAHPPWRPVLEHLLEGLIAAGPRTADRLRDRLAPDPFRHPGWLQPQAQRWLDEVAAPPGAWKHPGLTRSAAMSLDRVLTRVPALGMFDDLRRLGRSTGTELRTPLFDVDLYELVISIDPGLSCGSTMPKPLLRAALRGHLPEAVRMRALKTRFDPLLIEAVAGPDRRLIERALTRDGAEVHRYVQPGKVRDLLAARPASPMDAWRHAQVLWRLTALECWLRGEADPAAPAAMAAAAARRRTRIVAPPETAVVEV